MRTLSVWLCLCVLGVAELRVAADSVELAGGSVIVGKVLNVAGGKVTVETDFAGTLTIAQEKVVGITTTDACMVELGSGSTLVGTLSRQNGQSTVQTTMGPLDISKETVVALWAKGEDSPAQVAAKKALEAQMPKWKFDAYVNVGGKTGNTEQLSQAAGVAATLSRPGDRLKFFAEGENTKTDHVRTASQLRGGMDYEYDMSERQAAYMRILLEYDEIKALDLRTTAAVGYGYYLLRAPTHNLRGRTGLFLRQESYRDADSEQTVGIDFGLHHDWQIIGPSKIVNDITYTPSFDDFGDYQINHESSYEIPLVGAKLWKLRLGVSNQYTSYPAGGKEDLDTTYFARLVFAWE